MLHMSYKHKCPGVAARTCRIPSFFSLPTCVTHSAYGSLSALLASQAEEMSVSHFVRQDYYPNNSLASSRLRAPITLTAIMLFPSMEHGVTSGLPTASSICSLQFQVNYQLFLSILGR